MANPLIHDENGNLIDESGNILVFSPETTCLTPTSISTKRCMCPPRIIVNPPPTSIFYNAPQTVTLTCPEGSGGDPIVVTVLAGTYSSEIDQATADALALADAQAQADALRVATPCVGEPSLVELFVRSISGVGDGVGCPGFDEPPGQPPIKYRRLLRTGTLVATYWDSSTCDGSVVIVSTCEYNAARSWDALTGVGPTETGGASCDGVVLAIGVPCNGGLFTSSCETQFTLSNLIQTQTDPGVTCCDPSGSGQPHYYVRSGTITVELSEPDTEEDAINRVVLTDGPFSSLPWTPCTGTACDSYTAQRVTLYAFIFKRSQIKIHAEGLPALTSVTLAVNIWEQLLLPETDDPDPGSPAVLSETQEYEETTDGSGVVDFIFDLVPRVGYRFYVDSYDFIINP